VEYWKVMAEEAILKRFDFSEPIIPLFQYSNIPIMERS